MDKLQMLVIMLKRECKIQDITIENMNTWNHSGFSI